MRRFVCAVLLLCLLLTAGLPAQAQEDFLWTLRIGAEGSVSAHAMCLMPEGGAYLVGSVEGEASCGAPLGGQDAYIAYTDTSGEVVWEYRLGGSGDEYFTHVIEAIGGGCLAMGITESVDGDCRASRGMQDAFLARISETGEILWTKCLGGSREDELLNVSRCEEGGYLVCGRSRSYTGDLGANLGGWDAWAMLLFEEDGKPQWVIRHGGEDDESFSIILGAYDRWVLVGTVESVLTLPLARETPGKDTPDEYVRPLSLPIAVSVDSAGNILWEKTLADEGVSILSSAHETESGWMLAGSTDSTSALMPSNRGGRDLWGLSMRHNGLVIWQRTYGGEGNETLHSLLPAEHGGCLYLATTSSSGGQVFGSHGKDDLWVIKTTSAGTLEWQQALGGGERSIPAGIVSDGMGGYYVAGSTVSQDGDIGAHPSLQTGFLCHLASNGNLLSTTLVGGTEEFTAVSLQRSEEGIYLLGNIRSAQTTGVSQEIWLGKLLETY